MLITHKLIILMCICTHLYVYILYIHTHTSHDAVRFKKLSFHKQEASKKTGNIKVSEIKLKI